MSEMPEIVTITTVVNETPTVKTFVFDKLFAFRPGQFCMVWIPGVDEIPMAFSAANSITVMKVGDATEALFSLETVFRRSIINLGIRGPFGNGHFRAWSSSGIFSGSSSCIFLNMAITRSSSCFEGISCLSGSSYPVQAS